MNNLFDGLARTESFIETNRRHSFTSRRRCFSSKASNSQGYPEISRDSEHANSYTLHSSNSSTRTHEITAGKLIAGKYINYLLDFKDNIFVPSSMHSTKMSMDSAAMQPHHSSQSSLFSVAHMLHGSRFCIVHWILTNNDCPMCRSDYSVVHSEKLVCPIVGTGRGG